MIANTQKIRNLPVILFCFLLTFGVGCADKQKIAEEKKAEHWKRATQYLAAGEYPEAVIELQNVIRLAPLDEEAHYELGIAFMHRQKVEDAFKSFFRAASINPGNLKARLKLGQICMLAKNIKDARAHVEILLKRAPENLEVLTLLADIQTAEQDFDSAVETLEKIRSLYPEDVKTYLSLGQLYLLQQDPDRADKAYLRAAAVNPLLEKVMIRKTTQPYQSLPVLAYDYEKNGKWNKAENLYLEALDAAEDKVNLLKHLAAFYSRTHAYPKALNALEQAYAIREDVDILLQTARLHFHFGSIHEAEIIVDDILGRFPGYVDANLLKGRIYRLKRDYENAVERFEQAVLESPGSAAGHYYLGISRMNQGDIEAARRALDHAVMLNPKLTDARMSLAGLILRYFKTSDLHFAREHIEAVLNDDPNHLEALMLMGGLRLRENDSKSAEEVFQKVVELHPDHAAGHYKLGLLYRLLKQNKKALTAFEKSLALDPSQTGALSLIVDIHLINQAFEKALDVCNAYGEKIGGRRYFGAINEGLKGRIYLAMQNDDKALEHFEASVEKDPQNLSSHMMLARLYFRDQNIAQIISHFENTLKMNPKFLPAYMMLGMSYDRLGEREKSETYYRKALEIKTDFAPAANNLAWSLVDRDIQVNEALQLAQLAKDVQPDNPHVLDTLGWVYFKLGHYGKAIIELEKSVSLLPDNPLYTYHLAKAYDQNNQPGQAKGYFEKALKLNSNFTGAEDAHQTLKKYRSLGQ